MVKTFFRVVAALGIFFIGRNCALADSLTSALICTDVTNNGVCYCDGTTDGGTVYLISTTTKDVSADFALVLADDHDTGVEEAWQDDFGACRWTLTTADANTSINPSGKVPIEDATVTAAHRAASHTVYTVHGDVIPSSSSSRTEEDHTMTLDVTFLSAVVTFAPSPIKVGLPFTGVTVANPSPHSITPAREVVATVDPASKTTSIQLAVSGQNRASIFGIVQDATNGTITFDVSGTSATPSNQPNGDTTIVASDTGGSSSCGTAQVIVLKPAAISPHSVASGVPNGAGTTHGGINMLANLDSVPTAWDATTGNSYLWTWYGFKTPMQVVDQFGSPLTATYEGAVVTEGGSGINQTLSSSGGYQDAVGRLMQSGVGLVSTTGGTATAWPGAAKIALSPANGGPNNADTAIEIGGISIAATSGRKISWSTAAGGDVTITITWP